MAYSYEDEFRKILKADGKMSTAEKAWAVADAFGSVFEDAVPVIGVGQAIYTLASSNPKAAICPNPYFVANGHDERPSPATMKYMKNRMWVSVGGTAISVAGAAAAAGTMVDVGALAQHGNATASTVAHLIKFKSIAASYKQSQTISGWMDLIIRMKAMKTAVRGGQLAAAIISPIPFGGATAVSATASILATGAKLGIKLKMSNTCLMTAMELHWRAFQEQALLSGVRGMGAGTGPATRILQELFIRRGATRVFGQHNVMTMVQEPGGWKAIGDKLLLI